MSDLQIVLIVIGGFIIAAVLVYNWWQERRFLKQIESNFSQFKNESDNTQDSTQLPEKIDLRAPSSPANSDQLRDQDFTISALPIHEASEDAAIDEASIEKITGEETAFTISTASSEPITPSQSSDSTEPLIADVGNENHASKPANIGSQLIDEMVKEDNLLGASAEAAPDEIIVDTPQVASPNDASNLPEKLHRQVDLIVELKLQQAMKINELAKQIQHSLNDFDKPLLSFAWTAPDWLPIDVEAAENETQIKTSSTIVCGIQLADRGGAISKSVLNHFKEGIEQLVKAIDAQPVWHHSADPYAEATALDAFCIEVDKTMGFHVLHGDSGPFTGTKLRGLAEAQGMTLATDGTFKHYDESSNALPDQEKLNTAPMFIMFNRERYPFNTEMLRNSVVKSITFQLDIPHTANCIDAFNQMVSTAKQIATGLNAQIVDDNNRVLNDVQIEKIRHQLREILATMQIRGIVTGSELARRLFS